MNESIMSDLLCQMQACEGTKEEKCNLRMQCENCQDKLSLLFELAGAYKINQEPKNVVKLGNDQSDSTVGIDPVG